MWMILFFSENEQDLRTNVVQLNEVCEEKWMNINLGKIKVVVSEKCESRFNEINEFMYLGSMFQRERSLH